MKYPIMRIMRQRQSAGFFILRVALLVVFLILIVVGLGAGITIAKAGLARIPVLTNALYKPYIPDRIIDPNTVIPSIQELITSKVLLLANERNQTAPTIQFDEEEMTALLRLYTSRAPQFEQFREPQITLNEGTAEFFSYLDLKKTSTTIRVVASLQYDGSTIHVRAERITIGAISIPATLINLVFAAAFSERVKQIERDLEQSPISSLQIKDKNLEVGFRGDMLNSLVQ